MNRGKIAIAFGGGGARGLAHLGVLKVLDAANIQIDYIAGTSIGALIGALYALNPDTEEMYRKFLKFLQTPTYRHARFEHLVQKRQTQEKGFWSHFGKLLKKRLVLNLAQSRMSLIGTRKVEGFFRFFLGHKTFDDLKIPFLAASADLVTGQEVLHNTGLLTPAVMASSAIPGFLPPVFDNGKILVDGVVLNPVPVRPAQKFNADILIAVDVGKAFSEQASVENIIDIILRTHLITAHRVNSVLLEGADLVIQPEVGQYHWAEFKQYQEIIHAGEVAAKRVLPVLQQILHQFDSKSVYLEAI